jgi:hypothetical protein
LITVSLATQKQKAAKELAAGMADWYDYFFKEVVWIARTTINERQRILANSLPLVLRLIKRGSMSPKTLGLPGIANEM